MSETQLKTKSLNLIPLGLAKVLAEVDAMSAAEKVHMSADWLAQLHRLTGDDPWTLGFSIVHRDTGNVIGRCGFKGPPSADGMVEIAYGVNPDQQGQGYATEAAEALLLFAFDSALVRVLRAHTAPESNASTRVLAKCGFHHIGEIIDPEDGLVWRWEKLRGESG